jgi:[citrate (pro-3S)-lyase] ligase
MMEIQQKKLSISSFFLEKNFNNIAIYGAGTVGNAIYEEIHREINVKYFIDKNIEGMAHGIPIVKPEDVTSLENVDAILISPYFEHRFIERELTSFTNIKTVSIIEIIARFNPDAIFLKISDFLQNKGAFLYIIDRPLSHHVKNASVLELSLQFGAADILKARKNTIEYIREFHKEIEYYSEEYFNDVFRPKGNTAYHNTINGFRFLPDQLDEFSNTVYVYGDCMANGDFAEDKQCFANQLQIRLKSAGAYYKVVQKMTAMRFPYALLKEIEKITLKPGDIILHISAYGDLGYKDMRFSFFREASNIRRFSLDEFFKRPHDFGEIFFDQYHMAYKGQALMAEGVCKILTGDRDMTIPGDKTRQDTKTTNISANSNVTADLIKYTDFLSSQKISGNAGKTGAVVVNCNPFTLGHQYLIETASKLVDYLYIFVVEEDLSEFKFADRFEMVKLGLSHLSNIKVLPGGNFIISAFTFPGYFNKSDTSIPTVDASKDVEIFAQHIAPTLDISVRFVGNEPLSAITRQYNRDLREILPRYGIEYKEFERVEFLSQPISA